MTQFQFDTSGQVIVNKTRIKWSDLSPFMQGYVEAMFAQLQREIEFGRKPPFALEPLGFSDLAPETLARIMEDCERYRVTWWPPEEQDEGERGGRFWANRQNGTLYASKGFLPQTPYLGEDGKIYLRETGQ